MQFHVISSNRKESIPGGIIAPGNDPVCLCLNNTAKRIDGHTFTVIVTILQAICCSTIWAVDCLRLPSVLERFKNKKLFLVRSSWCYVCFTFEMIPPAHGVIHMITETQSILLYIIPKKHTMFITNFGVKVELIPFPNHCTIIVYVTPNNVSMIWACYCLTH